MKLTVKFWLTTILFSLSILESYSQLIINEIMQSNVDCITDDLNEFPDSWVELYNSSKSIVNLGEYKIGVTDRPEDAWQLRSENVASGRYVIIYCDKEANGKHTNFRLESDKGGAVYLFHNNEVVDQLTNIAKQPAPNVAYGRQTDTSLKWGYQNVPTPGAANCGKIVSELLGEPIFNVPGKVVNDRQSIVLTLSLPEGSPDGSVIRMTYDGSEPTSNSSLYTTPITINSTRTIRAKIFCDGYISPRSTTHSYIYFNRDVTLPVVSIVTDNKYFYDNKFGIYVDGTYNSGKKNYEYDWRRPINIEMFESVDEESVINQVCETRVQGGASRGSQLKSLIIYANKRFGQKRLKYEFFPDQKPGMDKFKSIILRNAGNDFDYLYMRDAIIQRTMATHTDLDWQAWRPVIIYINGTYKGMLNVRERSTDDYVWGNYDGLEDIDMIENWYELKAGDKENYEQFQNFYNEHGHTLAEYANWIDWEEFINLMVMNLYYNNQDFPGNNIVMWRNRSEDGRWRFVAKDTDFGLGLYGSNANYNTIKWLYDPNYDSNRNWANHYEHTRLFRRMMEDEDFKREFIDRASIYMGDFMNSQGTREIWDPMYNMIKTEYPNHRKLINQWWPNYDQELSQARQWIDNRTGYFYQHLKDYYSLGTITPMVINNNLTNDELQNVDIRFNGIKLSRGKFDGKFYANRKVTLQGIPVNGKKVTGWSIICVKNSGTDMSTISGSEYTFNLPTCNKMIINAIIGEESEICETSVSRSWKWHKDGALVTLTGIVPNKVVKVYNIAGQLLYQTLTDGSETIIHLPEKGVFIIQADENQVKIQN